MTRDRIFNELFKYHSENIQSLKSQATDENKFLKFTNSDEYNVEFILGGHKYFLSFTINPFTKEGRYVTYAIKQNQQNYGTYTMEELTNIEIIMDIEGGELEVLQQSADLLKAYRLVIIELHEFAIGIEGVETCRNILRQSGLFRVDQAGLTEAWQRD